MDQSTAFELLRQLGVTEADLLEVQRTPFPQSVALLDSLKSRVRSQWKKLAFTLHPDRTGGDETKTKLFRDLTKVKDDFQKLIVQSRPAPPPPVIVIMHHPTTRPFASASPFQQNTRTTTINVQYVTTMRPR